MRRASPSGRDRPSHQAGPFLRKRLLPHQPFWPGKSEILKSAVEVGSLLGRAALRRMLGFGLLGVLPNGQVEVLVSPTAPMPRKNTHRRSRLVEEHRSRRGDPAEGGGSRTPIMTAYRQRALACAAALAQGLRRPRDLKASIPDAYNILHRNVYGWFVAIERGVLRPDRDGSEGASALAADDFAARFALPRNRRIEADHCLKINPE